MGRVMDEQTFGREFVAFFGPVASTRIHAACAVPVLPATEKSVRRATLPLPAFV